MKRVRSFIGAAILALGSILVAGTAMATAQAPDILKHGKNTYYIHTNPLSPYLEAHPAALPAPEVTSSGLWRGYIATWSLGKDNLYLQDVRVPTRAPADSKASEGKQYRSVMKELFGDTSPRVATWFTGHLIVPTGELVNYVHMGYASSYSSYMVATIVEGSLREVRKFTLDEFESFRRAQFEAFKKTPEYATARTDAQNEGKLSVEQIDEFIFSFYSGQVLSRIFEPSSR